MTQTSKSGPCKSNVAHDVVPVAGMVTEADPAFAMYQEWKRSHSEWLRLSGTDDWDAPHMVDLEKRYMSIEDAVSSCTPKTTAQAALLAFVVWENEGPPFRKDNPEYQKALEAPHTQTLLRLKEWAESVLEA